MPCTQRMNISHTTSGILKNAIGKIPKSYILYLGWMLGTFLYCFDVYHRRIVQRNLRFSHPEWSRNQIQDMQKRFFWHCGITILEILQMTQLTSENIVHHLRVDGERYLLDALARRKGVIMVSGHLGNWEMAWQFAPCYYQQHITAVAKRMRNPKLDRFIHSFRTRFGNRIIYKKGALLDMFKSLRQGNIVALLMDVSRRFEGVEVQFLGRRATATPAAALLAQRCKSPVIPAFCHRTQEGELILQIEPPVEMIRTNDRQRDLQTNTQAITARIESAILKYPEQWFWILKRWKEFYPKLYPESAKRMRKIKKKARKRNAA